MSNRQSAVPAQPAANEAAPEARRTLRAKRLPLYLPPTIGRVKSPPPAPPPDVRTTPLWAEAGVE